MALNNTTTLRRLIQQYKEWADAHPMINKFGYGDFLELYSESEPVYPYFMINCNNVSQDQWYIKFQIEIFIAQWVFDERQNQTPAESLCLEILRQCTETVRYSERWNQFSKMQGDQSGFKVIQRGEDKITGWGITHNIWVKRKSGICDLLTLMPEYDFETQDTTQCSASVTGNGTLMAELVCGDSFTFAIKDTDGNVVGTYNSLTQEWIVPASGGGDPIDITVNDTLVYDQVTTDQTLRVVDQADNEIGSLDGPNKWLIENSVVHIKDTANNTLYDVSVLAFGSDTQVIDDVTVDLVDHEGTLIYTEDVLAEGVTEITMPIIYIRPANSGYGTTSYLTGDEGYNETNYPAPAQSSYGRPAILDPNDPKKLVYNNAFGHKHRFTGINGGYYDYATSQYKLADGTVSNQATVFGTTAGGTSYIIDNHTGIGAKWNGQGAAIFSSLVTTVLGLTHAGFSDYWIGSRKQHESWIAGLNIALSFTAIVPFNITQVKTSTPTFALETTNHHQLANTTMNQTRADGSADSCYAFRWHF
jgi:hypothetical protein